MPSTTERNSDATDSRSNGPSSANSTSQSSGEASDKKSLPFLIFVILTTLLITHLPMIWGYAFIEGTPGRYWYSGFINPTADNCVYLSWTQNSAAGNFWERNLYTSEQQARVKFNVYYYLLG